MVFENMYKNDSLDFEVKKAKLSIFCLQNGPRFGKSQLLNVPTLANQNKNKMARKFEFESFSCIAVQ